MGDAGGQLLRGGLTYFASQVGWSANTVKSYEVILADGSVVEAPQRERSDLWWALKGGSNNFGIVTRYDMQTLPITDLYGSTMLYDSSNFQVFLDAISDYVFPGGGSDDPKAAIVPVINVTPATGVVEGSLISFYYGNDQNPKVLQRFAKILHTFTNNTVQNSFLSDTNLITIPAYGARTEQ